MSTEEFSIQFDVLYNNVTSNQAPGLNEFEKSVFLTKAQSQLVIEYFNRRTDAIGGGFDGSEHRQYDFSSIVRTENLFNVNTYKERISNLEKLNKDSIVYLFPYNYFLAVNEVITDNKYQHSVMPIDYSEYQRLMLKPYTFPVKRGAWRIITDKKNCNFVHEDASGNSLAYDEVASADYKILTTWADQKRNLKVVIKSEFGNIDGSELSYLSVPASSTSFNRAASVYATDTEIYFKVYFDGADVWRKIVCDAGWKGSTTTYTTSVALIGQDEDAEAHDDENTIELLKIGFELLKYFVDKTSPTGATWEILDWETVKTATHTDGFAQCSAPSQFKNFGTSVTENNVTTLTGRTFITKVITIPMVEVIGRFSGTPKYQMKYVRTLTPIILADLSDYGSGISIDGIKKVTECVLPEECHQEILERAVTLAKIAWAGATATQVANQQRG